MSPFKHVVLLLKFLSTEISSLRCILKKIDSKKAGTESHNSVYGWIYMCLLLSPHPPPVLPEEGSSQTCVGAAPRDLSLYDIMSPLYDYMTPPPH